MVIVLFAEKVQRDQGSLRTSFQNHDGGPPGASAHIEDATDARGEEGVGRKGGPAVEVQPETDEGEGGQGPNRDQKRGEEDPAGPLPAIREQGEGQSDEGDEEMAVDDEGGVPEVYM